MMQDIAKLQNANFKRLAEAGCKFIQLDEPLLTLASEEEAAGAVEAINIAIEGLPPSVHVGMHICQGNYAVGKEYDGQIGHRYFDVGRYKADLICKINCGSYLVEYDMAHHYEGHLGDKQLGVGAVDVQDPKAETGEMLVERIRACKWLGPEQTVITSTCGFNHLPRLTALEKMRAMTQAKHILGA
jgi:5-methyltetrahydropteroyltriglutamate--homocysteine methyltransferase